jgi:diguanylate cyclase (GGDEF)-like protein
MLKRKLGRTPSVARDVNGVATQYLISYLQDFEPEGTLQKVLREAGETRSPKMLQSAACWSSYAQFRRLLEATASVLDGLTTLIHVSDHVFDSNQSPELSGSMTSLASPADTYAMLPELMESTIPIVELQTETVSSTECRVRLRFRGDFEPFPEYCAFEMSMLGTIPRVFGAPEAEVFIESCQCEGDEYCQALLRWSPIDDVAARVSNAEIRRQLSESRLRGLQRTLADLVSGDDLQTVLTRVMEAVASAVPARQYILDIDAGASRPRMLCAIGIDEAEGTRTADDLLHGLHDTVPRATARTALPETPRHIHLTAVASDKKRYGTLVSIRSEVMSFQPAERSILESYARLAASALDSENAILEARQQTTSAQVLLTLSASLSELVSTDEMASRIAQAVPFVVNCDRVVVWLIEPGDSFGRAVATHGFDRATEAEWHTLTVAIPPPSVIPLLAFHHALEPGRAAFSDLLVASGSKAAVSFPILYDGEPYGWITVDVTDHPERLDDDIEITERLRALGGQAAVAIRNGRLLGEIRHQALHDSLTGLPNRVLVLDRISQTLSRARREHTDVAVLFIDLDGLKDINDTLGHATGDRLLQAVGARFSGTLREADTVARLGGDEFVVLADGLSLAGGPEQVAERLLEVLTEPFSLGGNGHVRISISASIGIASGLRDTAEELLRDADIAMYAAKGSGKNCYAVFETEMHRERRGRHELEADLQAAIGTEQFFLAYQPIFDLSTMAVVGVEALLRWQHPLRGLLQPDEFIPALETSGLIIPVGRWVLLEACRQAMEWRADGDSTRMSVNASARQLDASSLVNDVSHALAMTDLPADDLIVEITETGLMRDAKGAQEQLVALKALGVRIAIDDFGTGYSSLAYLQQFPIDTLKIDRTFIAGMGASPEGSALIHTFMQLGRALHLETLAEGIEEVAQLSQLQAERCQLGQGYLLARPLTPDGIKEMFLVERASY